MKALTNRSSEISPVAVKTTTSGLILIMSSLVSSSFAASTSVMAMHLHPASANAFAIAAPMPVISSSVNVAKSHGDERGRLQREQLLKGKATNQKPRLSLKQHQGSRFPNPESQMKVTCYLDARILPRSCPNAFTARGQGEILMKVGVLQSCTRCIVPHSNQC